MTTTELPFTTRTEVRNGRTFEVVQWGAGRNERAETEIIVRAGRTFELTRVGREWLLNERIDADTLGCFPMCKSRRGAIEEIDWVCPAAGDDGGDE